MKIEKIAELAEGEIICAGNAECDTDSVYAGDFLSRVMGKAPPNSVWITIMNNVNVAAVAALADIKVIVLCEGVKPDELLKAKCDGEGIAIISTKLSAYECCRLL